MFENDAVHAFQQRQSTKKPKVQGNGLPIKDKRDDFIMDTNSSSIVSKRSVEKLYFAGEPEYFRFFVRKFQRRSPVINRGYWLRMKAIDHEVRRFLVQEDGKQKLVVNLGCGYDPLPFQYLGKHRELCRSACFVDVDYPPLMRRKMELIQANPALRDLVPDLIVNDANNPLVAHSKGYAALACDLRHLDKLGNLLRQQFDCENRAVAFLFVAEVSVAYMERQHADELLCWAATFKDARFCLLEQHLPDGRDHPFAATMLKHFEKLRTPLHAIGTIEDMTNRFAGAGWPIEGINIRSLWDLWADPEFLTFEQRRALDDVEPFDEWEEFALFGAHYFLLVADTRASTPKDASSSFSPEVKQRNNLDRQADFSCIEVEGSPMVRRFGACFQDIAADHRSEIVIQQGGLGSQERRNAYEACSCANTEMLVTAHSRLPAVMCHTTTTLTDGSQSLLVGGRYSPDKASSECWTYSRGSWQRISDLHLGRYRHCAVALTLSTSNNSKRDGVLVFGGRSGMADILDEWLFWNAESGWHTLPLPEIRPAAAFGASIITDPGTTDRGILLGGMRADGTINVSIWSWKVSDQAGHTKIEFSEQHETHLRTDQAWLWSRFGATIVHSSKGRLLIGGIANERLLSRDEEIVNLDSEEPVIVPFPQRPLLVGISAVSATNTDMLILGGGATCFSFGTFWSPSYYMRVSTNEHTAPWQVIRKIITEIPQERATQPALSNDAVVKSPEVRQIRSVGLTDAAQFAEIMAAGEPIILTGLQLGSCTQSWTPEYLKEAIGPERKIVAHESTSPYMDFQQKNFSYTTRTVGDFLDDATAGKPVYLRALSADKPADKPTDIASDFPSIAADFSIPQELAYVKDNAHSSPLRISGPVAMWLHYDVMANVLCQIRGSKRLLLYPPSDVRHLSFEAGASSSSLNPFTAEPSTHPQLLQTHMHEAILQPGDVLFIPPLWLHAAEPTEGLSVAVNTFFKDDAMLPAYAAGKDVYANRDVAAYERGRRDVSRIAKSFEGLPSSVKHFYLQRLADELQSLVR